jgi:hypothetical protein
MITDARFVDIDKDGKKELVVCGEWNSIRVFTDKNGALADVTSKYFKDSLSGFWNKLHFADMDGDGDMDLVAGNWGLNSPLKVSPSEPAEMFYGDFDNNGSVDPLICHYIDGKSYPMASRDELTDQMVSLRQKFPTYADYANTTIKDILTEEQLKSAKRVHANHFETSYFENNKGSFQLKRLPVEANLFPVYAMESDDFDKDGHMDILLAGNIDEARIRIGKMDAGYGTILKGNGKGEFTYVPQLQSGLSVKNCTRDIVKMKSANKNMILFSVNRQPLSVYSY